jgi:hypothetical protein
MKTFFTVLTALLSIFYVNSQTFIDLAVEKQFPDNTEAVEVFQAAIERQMDPATPASKITWVANKLTNNWFFSLEGGLAWLGSENFEDINVTDNLKFTGGLALGRWFNPVFGSRFTVSGAKLSTLAYPGGSVWYIGQNHSGISGTNSALSYIIDDGKNPGFFNSRFYNDGKPYKDGYLCDFTYLAANVDLMINLKNLFKPYNPDAFFNPVLYGGIGFAHTLKEGDRTAVNEIMQRYGLQFNFRLADRCDLFLATEMMVIPEVFDRQVGGDILQDIVVSVKLGLTFHFGFNKFIKAPMGQIVISQPIKPDATQINALNNRINELQKRLIESEKEETP